MAGELVTADERSYRIVEVVDYESVLATDLETGRKDVLKIAGLAPLNPTPAVIEDLESIADADLQLAKERFDAIKPILGPEAGRKAIEQRASEVEQSVTTLYRWRKRYLDAGSLEGLIPEKRGVRRGTRRLSVHAEQIISAVVHDYYLTVQRPSAQRVVDEVRRRVLEADLPDMPHANTVRARIAELDPRTKLKARGHTDRARNLYDPAPGAFPHVDYPLSVVQIDHTPVDLILVDDVHRLPIGKPWITLAIDVFSRMVAGYYLSFDPPSVTSVAMCVANAVMPKGDWLTLHGVNATWPIQGIMDKIHVDNGAEFRSEAFRTACMMHGIDLEYRPVGRKQYGGHIERLLGTSMRNIHALPGTTFSSVAEKGEYDSEKHSAMTISEFEEWFVGYVCNVYHKSKHGGIGLPPEKKWEIGVFGNKQETGHGLRPVPADRHAFALDFMPNFQRTVQPRGVSIDGLHYYADVLRGHINATDPDRSDEKRKFIFRRDPRDISVVWFHDPDLKQYFRVPFADQSLPSMSLWEYREARNRAHEECKEAVDERAIARAIGELRQQVTESAKKTKKARRALQRRKEHAKAMKFGPIAPPVAEGPALVPAAPLLSDEDVPVPEDIS